MSPVAFRMLFSSNPSRIRMCSTFPAISSIWTWRAKVCWSATGRSERPVGGGSDVGFEDLHFADARTGPFESAGDLIVKVPGHVLRRRIDGVKRGDVVQELMIQAADDGANQLLDVPEIDQQADGIQLLAFHRHLHPVVVAVHIFALAAIVAQGMSRRECLFHGNFKHRKTSPRRQCWW